jgi:hypothetical protein
MTATVVSRCLAREDLVVGVRGAIAAHAVRARTARASSTRSCSTSTSIPWASTTTTLATSAGFAPPGDVHRIRDTSDATAISLHIYGTDVTRIGTSAATTTDLRH